MADNAAQQSSRARYERYRKDDRERRARGEIAPVTSWHHAADPSSVRMGRHRSTKRHRSFTRLFAQFWKLLYGHHLTLIAALATLSLSTLLGLIPLSAPKFVFDNVLGGKPLSPRVLHYLPWFPREPRLLLAFVAVSMFVIAVLSLIVGTWGRWQTTRISKRVVVAARRKVFDHAVRLPLHRVYEMKSGGVTSILREDASGVGELVFSMIYNPWRAIVQLIGSLVVLTMVDWRLLIGSLLLLPTVWITHKTWIGRIRPIFRDIAATRQGVDAHATESFGGMRVVRSFGRQRTEVGQFTRGNHLMARQELLAWWWSRAVEGVWGVLIPLASSLLLWYGGLRILNDMDRVHAGLLDPARALTVGDLVMFLTYLTALLGPIATLAQSATGLQTNLAGLDRTLDVLEEPAEMPNRPGAIHVEKHSVVGRITIRDLSFAYPGAAATKVLSDIHLDVAPGQTIALVGPSGAGKTTLCNLIARFYDPTEGSIFLDGVDLRDIDLDAYRRLLGIVEQDTFLFDGTIRDNIAYGRRDASDDDVTEAARLANAHEFISKLERGYDTLIGERGVKLSGGQRQRLTIARAILADPKILILDEATSNLDTESERLIQRSLQTLMAGRTSFVIAHRLSTIAGADLIVVIDHGRIVEMGTHEELMTRSGRYQQMVDLQTRPPAPDEEKQEEAASVS